MPEIPSIGHGSVGPTNRAVGVTAYRNHTAPRMREARTPHADRVELSRHARLLDELRRLPEVRSDLVEQIRRAIEQGTYDTPAKLDAAIERLIADQT
jgi:anti-sigma28 factor (negative regulator of flagellin synthesis)